MEFLVMPQTTHSLVECYSASGGGDSKCCFAGGIRCTCNDGSTYEPCVIETCTCKGVLVPVCGVKNSCIALCANKSCTVKADIMNQP